MDRRGELRFQTPELRTGHSPDSRVSKGAPGSSWQFPAPQRPFRMGSSLGVNRSNWHAGFQRTNSSSIPLPCLQGGVGALPPGRASGPTQGLPLADKDISLVSPSEWRGSCFPESLGRKRQERAQLQGWWPGGALSWLRTLSPPAQPRPTRTITPSSSSVRWVTTQAEDRGRQEGEDEPRRRSGSSVSPTQLPTQG